MRTILEAMALTLVLATAASAYTAAEYWPKQAGNQWEYEVTGHHNALGTHTMEITQRIRGWAMLDGFEGSHWLWMSTADGTIWSWNSRAGQIEEMFDLDTAAGQEMTSQANSISCMAGARWEVVDRHATATVPTGRYRDCLVLERTFSHCRDSGYTRLVLAPNVGLIEFERMTIMGSEHGRLSAATVNGQSLTSQLPVQISLETDAFEYSYVIPGVPGAPIQPATMQVRFKIGNDTQESWQFLHHSGQQYDFVIRHSSGREMFRWSDGRMFTKNIWTDTIAPGHKRLFQETLDLVDSSGNPLPAGSYTIEAVHHTEPEETRIGARIKFTIDVVHAP